MAPVAQGVSCQRSRAESRAPGSVALRLAPAPPPVHLRCLLRPPSSAAPARVHGPSIATHSLTLLLGRTCRPFDCGIEHFVAASRQRGTRRRDDLVRERRRYLRSAVLSPSRSPRSRIPAHLRSAIHATWRAAPRRASSARTSGTADGLHTRREDLRCTVGRLVHEDSRAVPGTARHVRHPARRFADWRRDSAPNPASASVPRRTGVSRKCPDTPISIERTPPGFPRRSMTMPSASRDSSTARSIAAASGTIQTLNRTTATWRPLPASLTTRSSRAKNVGRWPSVTGCPCSRARGTLCVDVWPSRSRETQTDRLGAGRAPQQRLCRRPALEVRRTHRSRPHRGARHRQSPRAPLLDGVPASSAGLDGSTRAMTSSPSIGVRSAPIATHLGRIGRRLVEPRAHGRRQQIEMGVPDARQQIAEYVANFVWCGRSRRPRTELCPERVPIRVAPRLVYVRLSNGGPRLHRMSAGRCRYRMSRPPRCQLPAMVATSACCRRRSRSSGTSTMATETSATRCAQREETTDAMAVNSAAL